MMIWAKSANKGSIGSADNGLSPIWRQAIIYTNARLLSTGILQTNFSEILIKIQNFHPHQPCMQNVPLIFPKC